MRKKTSVADAQSTISASDALKRLKDGNERFLAGEQHPLPFVEEMLRGLQHGQQLYATILGCSDSRVPPEIIFDSTLGELFVIRVAGNVFSHEIAGSIQYAGAYLHTPLFVVLGHQSCGAVNAALLTRDRGDQYRSRIQVLVDSILPGLPPFDPQLSPAERTAQAVEGNIRWTMKQIVETPEAQQRLAEGYFKIIGALFEISTGRVKFLE